MSFLEGPYSDVRPARERLELCSCLFRGCHGLSHNPVNRIFPVLVYKVVMYLPPRVNDSTDAYPIGRIDYEKVRWDHHRNSLILQTSCIFLTFSHDAL